MIDFLDIPLPSTGWFILAGILLGFVFWYRDNTNESPLLKAVGQRYKRARKLARQRKNELLDLQSDHEVAQAHLKNSNNRRQVLSQKSFQLERLLQRTQNRLEHSEREKKNAEAQLSAERQRTADLNIRLQESQQESSALQQEIDQRQQTIERLEQARQQTESEFEYIRADLCTQIDGTTQSLAEHRALILRQEAELDETKDELEQLQQEHDTAVEQLSQRHSLIEVFQVAADEQDSELKQLQDVINELLPLRAQLANANLQLAEQTSHAAELVDTINSKEDDLESLRQSLQSMEMVRGAVATAIGEIDAGKERYESLQEEQRATHLALVKKQLEAQELNRQVESLKPLEGKLAEAEAEIKRHRESAAHLQVHVSARQAEIEQLEDQLGERSNEIADLQHQLRKHQAEQFRLNKETSARGSTVKLLRSEIGQLSERLGDQAGEISNLRDQLKQRQAAQESLQQQNNHRASANEKLKAEINHLRPRAEQLETTQEQLASITDELVEVTNDRDQLSKVREELERTVSQLRSQVATRSNRIKAVNELLKVKTQSHSRAALKLQKQVESQGLEVEQLRRQLEAKSDQLELKSQQHLQLADNLSSLKQRLEQSQADVEGLAGHLSLNDRLRSDNGKLHDQVEELAGEVRRLSGELNDNLAANDRAQERIRDLEYKVYEYASKLRMLRRDSRIFSDRYRDDRSGGRRAA